MEIKKVKKNKLNLMSLFSNEVEKAYEEGVYCDSPANRKLGRVGMTYKEWSSKQNEKKEDSKKDINKEYEDLKWEDVSERSNNKRECLIGHDGTREGFRTIKEAKDGTIYYSPKTEGEWIKITKEQAVKLANSDPGFSKERNIEKENEILQRSDKKEEKKEDKKDEKKTKSLDDINWQDTDSPLEKEYKTSEGILKKKRVGRFGGYSYSINGENISEEKALEIVNKKDKHGNDGGDNGNDKEKDFSKRYHEVRDVVDEIKNNPYHNEYKIHFYTDKKGNIKKDFVIHCSGIYLKSKFLEEDEVNKIKDLLKKSIKEKDPRGDYFNAINVEDLAKAFGVKRKSKEELAKIKENADYRNKYFSGKFTFFDGKSKEELEKYNHNGFFKKLGSIIGSPSYGSELKDIDFKIDDDGTINHVKVKTKALTMQGGGRPDYTTSDEFKKVIKEKLEGKKISDLEEEVNKIYENNKKGKEIIHWGDGKDGLQIYKY